MRKGAQSFVTYAAYVVPAIVGVAWISGSPSILLVLLGVFFVLQFANRLDRRS